jgi:hypothetical protein
MATVDMATWDGSSLGGVPSFASAVRHVTVIQREIDLAAAVTAKGSALAQADVIQALNIPAGFTILGGTAQKMTAMTGTSTDTTFDIGITGVDVDAFVDGWDFDAAAVSSWATPLGVQIGTGTGTAARTVDILIATQTGTITGGKLRVIVWGVDVSAVNRPGLAALQS